MQPAPKRLIIHLDNVFSLCGITIFHIVRIKWLTFYSDKRIVIFHVAKTPVFPLCAGVAAMYFVCWRNTEQSRSRSNGVVVDVMKS